MGVFVKKAVSRILSPLALLAQSLERMIIHLGSRSLGTSSDSLRFRSEHGLAPSGVYNLSASLPRRIAFDPPDGGQARHFSPFADSTQIADLAVESSIRRSSVRSEGG
ncbi:MAG: hypothetical protein AAB476_02150, partial [Patescibacteria group bacterium]